MGVGIEWDRRDAEDPHGFESIYRAHHKYVWQTLRAFGVREPATDDAVQDVFLVVYRRLGEFEGRAAIRTWLFEILRRVAWRYRTKAQREASRSDDLPELVAPVDLQADLERAQAFEVLQRFADELDEDRLRVFTLSVFGQLRGREISETLGVNLNTVYARLRSAHASLDRFVTRHRAREASATVRCARASAPERQQVRQTWAALVLQVGGAPASVVATTAVGAGWTAWAWASAGVVAASVVAAVVVANPSAEPVAPSSQVTTVAAVGGAGSGSSPTAVRGAPTVSTPMPVEPVAVANPTAPADDPPAAASSSATIPRARTAAALPESQRLAEEVAAVKEIQAAIDTEHAVWAAVERYRQQFPRGTLAEEVDALAIEHLCRQDVDTAPQRLAFKRRWPRSTLLRGLEKTCGVSIRPQKPRRPKTNSL